MHDYISFFLHLQDMLSFLCVGVEFFFVSAKMTFLVLCICIFFMLCNRKRIFYKDSQYSFIVYIALSLSSFFHQKRKKSDSRISQ